MNLNRIFLTITLAAAPGLVARATDAVSTNANTNATAATSAMPKQSYEGSSDNNYAGHFGAGVTLGEPIGASVKYWFNNTMAIDGALGWSYRDDTDLYLHSDVLWHDFNLIPVSQGRLPFYFGVGALVRFRHGHHDNQAGIRVPVGVSYMFENAPVDVFVEIAPALDVAPSLHGEVTGGIGIRYWF